MAKFGQLISTDRVLLVTLDGVTSSPYLKEPYVATRYWRATYGRLDKLAEKYDLRNLALLLTDDIC